MPQIEIDVSWLRDQAGEMDRLRASYEELFQGVTSTLNRTNNIWSANLASNFSGKIGAVQNGFAGVVSMLEYGAEAARISAQGFESVDSALAKVMGDGRVGAGAAVGAVVGAAMGSAMPPKPLHTDQNMVPGVQGAAGKIGSAVFPKPASTDQNMAPKSSIWDKVKGFGKKVKVGAAKTVDIIKDGIVSAATIVANDYANKGVTWKIAKTIGSAVKVVGAVSSIAAAWTAAAGTGGLATGGAVFATAYGANTVANSLADVYNAWSGNEEQVGKVNFLKGGMQSLLGDNVGNVVYAVGNVVSSAATISAVAGKVTQTKSVGEIFKDSDNIASTVGKEIGSSVKGVFNIAKDVVTGKTGLGDIGYQINLLKYEVPHVADLAGYGKILTTVGKTTKKTAEAIFSPFYEMTNGTEYTSKSLVDIIFGETPKNDYASAGGGLYKAGKEVASLFDGDTYKDIKHALEAWALG